MTSSRWLPIVLATAVGLASGSAVTGQTQDPRAAFTNALGTFALALRGEFGDEGPRLRSSLDQMRRIVNAWDADIRRYEAAMTADLPGATPEIASRMHRAIGAIYLDRGRLQDGLSSLAEAARLVPGDADIPAWQAAARTQLAGTPATSEFVRAAALAPDNAAHVYLSARSLSSAGRTEEAAATFARFLALDSRAPSESPFLVLALVPERPGVEPFFPPALYVRGFSLLRAGDYPAALDAFAEALPRDPIAADAGGAAAAIGRAAAAMREGSVETAIQQLTLGIAADPDRSELHRLLGLAYASDDQYDKAIDELRKAVALGHSDERSHLALAGVLVKSGALPAALRALTAALESNPGSGQAQYEIGLVHQREGRYADALAAFDRALAFTPLLGANSIYQTIGALHRAQQSLDAAAHAFSARVELVPNDSEAHRELGDIHMRQGRHAEALAEFSIVLTLDPKSSQAHAATAQVYLRDGRYAEAVDAATRVIHIDPDHREARYARATSLIRLGRVDDGRKDLDIFQKQQADDASARTRLLELEGLKREAAVSGAAGDHDKAVALLRKVVDADPLVPGSLLDLGFALIDAGKHRDALRYLDKAVELGAHYEVHRHLAAAYTVLGQDEDGRRERALYERLKRDALRRSGTDR